MKPPLSPSQHLAIPLLQCQKGSCSCSGLCPGWRGCSFPASSTLCCFCPVSWPCVPLLLQLPLLLPSAPALFTWSLFSAAPGSASGSSGLWEQALSLSIPRCSAHLAVPRSLGSPPPGAALSQLRSHPLPRGHLRNKATSPSTSVTAGEREHCCHSLCCLTSFSQIRSGRRKEMVNSAREFVCCHGRYKPGKEEHSLTVATFAFSGFPSRI